MLHSIRITVDGAVHHIDRDVSTVHPAAVHEALGTSSESELQRFLDQVHVDDWYGADGRHLGPDVNGLEMFRDDGPETYTVGRMYDDGGDGYDRGVWSRGGTTIEGRAQRAPGRSTA